MDVLFKLMGLDLICEYLIKSSLVLGCALLLVFILRKKTASFRQYILSFALISLILIPFLSSFSAGWETKLVPDWAIHKSDSSITNTRMHRSFFFNHDSNKMFIPPEKISTPSAVFNSGDGNKASFTADLYRKKQLVSLSIPFLWILGLVLILLKIIIGLNGASRLTRNGVMITKSAFHQILRQLRKVIAIKRKVSLLTNQQILIPITWGVVKPVIILPEGASRWTKSQCSSVLFHELSHIKRGDFIVRIIVRLICAFFWFNPIIWVVYNLMKKEQEKACDEMVLNSGIKPSIYAANLLSIKEAMHGNWRPPAAVLGVIKRSQFNNRLIAILKRQIKPKEIKMKSKILLSLIFIMVITVIGLAHPAKPLKLNGNRYLTEEPSINTTYFTDYQQDVADIQEQKQEKKATEERSNDQTSQGENNKGIRWVVKDGESGTNMLYITDADAVKYITDANEVKKIILDGKLILVEKDGKKKAFSIIPDGKECVIEKDDHGNWKIDGKLIELSNEDSIKVIKLGEVKDVVIKKEEEGSWTIKSDELDNIQDGRLYVLKKDDENPIVIQSKDSDSDDKIIKIFVPKLFIKTDKSGHKNFAIYIGDDEDKLKEIDASLISGHSVLLFADKDVLKVLGEECMIGYIKGEEGFQIIFKSDELDETQREEYAELFEKIKNKLEGRYEVEKEINEEDNTFILKIKSERVDTIQKIDMKKLLNEIVEEIKKVKESKIEKEI